MDSGCTNSTRPYKSDFKPNTLKKLDKPLLIEGVGGDIKVEYCGILNWEYISTTGEVVKLHHIGHYAPELQGLRLLSPQRYIEQVDNKAEFVVKHGRCFLKTGKVQ